MSDTARHHSLILHVAVWSHVVMGAAVLCGGEPATWATAVATSQAVVGGNPVVLGVLYVASSVLVLWEMWRGKTDLWAMSMYAPQQFFMVVSAWGAARAMWWGEFADGVPRPQAFIISDQHLWLFVGVSHSVALLDRFGLFRWAAAKFRTTGAR